MFSRSQIRSLAVAMVFCIAPLSNARADAKAMEIGKELYNVHCIGCHGHEANGMTGPSLRLKPLEQEKFIEIVGRGIPGTPMRAFKPLGNKTLAQIGDFIRSLASRPKEKVSGDPSNGLALMKGKGECYSCHMIRGKGGVLGPDLTNIWQKRGSASLFAVLRDPKLPEPPRSDAGKTFAMGPLQYSSYKRVDVKPKSGDSLTGVLVNKDPFSIQIRSVDGVIHSIHLDEVASIEMKEDAPFMPNYTKTLSDSEARDVVAYLLSLGGAK